MRRRPVVAVSFLVGALGAGWACLAWRNHADYGAAQRLIESHRYREARVILARLPADYADGASAYQHGLCEQRLGNAIGALAAWRRVPAQSRYASQANVARARIFLRDHRFADAEPLLNAAFDAPGETGFEATQTLAHILKLQGRWDEVIAIQENCLDRGLDRITLMRELWRLKAEPYPANEFAQGLETAAKAAPDDDRVLLGRAYLAIRTGQLDAADALLADCERRATHDAAVLRAALEWCIAAQAPQAAAGVLALLEPPQLTAPALVRVCAWIAGAAGDTQREYESLAALHFAGVANASDLERLAQIHSTRLPDAKSDSATDWRKIKAVYDSALPRYHELLTHRDPDAFADELTALAETLGWHAEAASWRRAGSRPPAKPPADIRPLAARLHQRVTAGLPKSDTPTAARRYEKRAQASRSQARTPAVPRFSDEGPARGIAFRFDNGATPSRQLPETMSGGVALLDFDRDGWMDVYVVQGGPFPPPPDARCADRLYRNRGDGTFDDVTALSGIADFPGGYGFGATVGDVNNDGYPDLFITRWRHYALYINQGNGTFADATASWGLAGEEGWPTSAAFADLDNDGDLDLYVCHYVRWNAIDPPICRTPNGDRIVYCAPVGQPGERDRLFRNDGNRFTNVTAEANVNDPETRGLGVVAADLDGDGLVDLFVANDMNRNLFFRNRGNLRFSEEAEVVGLSSNSDGGYLAGMGVALADIDRDSLPDIAITNFYGECTRLYRNLGAGQFADHTAAAGIAGPSRYLLGFGASFNDMNNDGYVDLFTVNGHVDDLGPTVPHLMPCQLLLGTSAARFVDAASLGPTGLERPRLGRGLATGDLNHDGWIDALVVDQEGHVPLYLNQGTGDSSKRASFVIFELQGTASNRDGVGAFLTLSSGNHRQFAWRFGGGSYQSAGDGRLHFGLGDPRSPVRLEIRWPSGLLDIHDPVSPGRGYRAQEGNPSLQPLPGF